MKTTRSANCVRNKANAAQWNGRKSVGTASAAANDGTNANRASSAMPAVMSAAINGSTREIDARAVAGDVGMETIAGRWMWS